LNKKVAKVEQQMEINSLNEEHRIKKAEQRIEE